MTKSSFLTFINLGALLFFCNPLKLNAQARNTGDALKINLSENGEHYVRFTFQNQIWLRYNEQNPGSTINGVNSERSFDIGLRRTRAQLLAQVNDKVFVYTQIGTNNLNPLSQRKSGIFFHDAVGELSFVKNKLSFGAGLTGWGGYARFSAPSTGTLASADAPIYQQTTNDINDQFLRKYSLYIKGVLGKLDYRLALSTPMDLGAVSAIFSKLDTQSSFALGPANPQFHGYLRYQFRDLESMLTPYNVGAYLGKKRVLALGLGFLNQRDALWRLESSDTLRESMRLINVDFFYDAPLNAEKGSALTIYAALGYTEMGKNFMRSLGVMNTANGNNQSQIVNGAGSAFPMVGSGGTAYGSVAYLFGKDMLGSWGTIQLFAASQISRFKALQSTMSMYEAGANWLINGHNTKLSVGLQNRPVFERQNGIVTLHSRKNMLYLQLQFMI